MCILCEREQLKKKKKTRNEEYNKGWKINLYVYILCKNAHRHIQVEVFTQFIQIQRHENRVTSKARTHYKGVIVCETS